jgi:hypothetical protein
MNPAQPLDTYRLIVVFDDGPWIPPDKRKARRDTSPEEFVLGHGAAPDLVPLRQVDDLELAIVARGECDLFLAAKTQ